ncbi:MAG: low affinity iron permease family protein [Planctomycetes bacterium]|nr:low affinity iron permease family protein [Planctomycetota bacterium]
MRSFFRVLSDRTATIVGSPWAFVATAVVTLAWLAVGPWCGYSDTWQLTMNTAASQVTFLIAFLLQSTQNRDTRALHLKLDELLRTHQGARRQLIKLEEWSDADLEALRHDFERLRDARGRGGPAG